jgi:hypothetical protein
MQCAITYWYFKKANYLQHPPSLDTMIIKTNLPTPKQILTTKQRKKIDHIFYRCSEL